MRIQSPRIQGFSLLELLVVVTLLAVLASVALLANDGVNDQAELDATRYEMAELRKALLQFRRNVGHFPDAAGLIAADNRLALLINCQATVAGVSYDAGCDAWNPDTHRGWHGPYVSSGFDKDAWGMAYQLLDPASDTAVTGTARLESSGPDKLLATTADNIVAYLAR